MKKIILILAIILPMMAAARSQNAEFARKLQTFNAIVKELNTNYVDTLQATVLMDNTIDALLSQIDPYTEYFPADNQEELQSLTEGKYAGIGATILKRDKNVIITDPRWDTPSRNAGLRAGDVILRINGEPVTEDMDVSEVSRRLRGNAGTDIEIDVRRPYTEDSLLTFRFVRADIKVDPLPYYSVDSTGVGYIALTTFNESTARQVRSAVSEMLATPGLKGIVIDLRGNGGGLLESAVQLVGNFVPRGTEVLRTQGRSAREQRIYKTTAAPLSTDVPLVILTNGGTASSSEIVAGSLQDMDRAVIIGSRSFGKGLVQTARPLPFGDLVKITTAKYYIPSGRLIQALDYSRRNEDGSPQRMPDSLTNKFLTRAGRTVRDGGGITPDIEVSQTETNRLMYNIVSGLWSFDYTNRYVATNPAPTDPTAPLVTDSIFADFKAFIDPARFQYDKQCEIGIDYLRDAAKKEGYMTDSVAAAINALEALLKHDLNHDLDLNRDKIVDELESEIAARYFREDVLAGRELPDDEVYQTARAVILDPERYRTLLSAPK
ncbi:MAG: S41 family peptidase [Bacteroidales bacterium]|nr:S41 family peptidase [Bacteroidales bacterium]